MFVSRSRKGSKFVFRGALVSLFMGSAFICFAQPLFSDRSLDSAMKLVGRNSGLMRSSLEKGDFDTAKIGIARMRDNLFPTIMYWRNHKEPEAVAFLKQAVTALDELDGVLSKPPVDAAAARAAAAKVGSACQSCHAVYRQQDPVSKAFSVKERR